MPPSEALRRDIDHVVVGLCSDRTLAYRHGTTEIEVRRTRREHALEVHTQRTRELAATLATLIDWEGSLGDLVEGVLAQSVAEHSALVGATDGGLVRSAGRGRVRQAGAPRSASGDAREIGTRGRPVREDGLGAGVAVDVGRRSHQTVLAPARRARGSGSDG